MKPVVAIVGRANVGKSRLFNRLVGQTRAIVHDKPGITRDRHYAPADWLGRDFIVVDTGGMELDPKAGLEHKVTEQSMVAVDEADVVVCVFDAQNPPTAEDEDVVRALRKQSKPVVWCINKVDSEKHEASIGEFARLGLDPLIMVSAEHGRNVDELCDAVIGYFPDEHVVEGAERPGLRIGVVGRPNVGKSTLINRLAGSDRVVAHEMPGTTRDAIDVEIQFEGKDYVFVDTAGVKKGWKSSERLEKYTSVRSLKAIERSLIVCQLIDGVEGVNRHDVALSSFVMEEGKGLIVLVNKWDMVEDDWQRYEDAVRHKLRHLGDIPVLCISAATGYHCLKVFETINRIDGHLSRHLSTSAVNKVLERSLAEHHLPTYKGKEVRVLYATQTGSYPPTFTLFSNMPAAVPYTYRRYLKRRFQDELGATEIPVRIVCRKK